MKKVLALAFFAAVAVNCSKKESTYEQDSNTMLTEPEAQTVDSGSVSKPADQTTVAADSAAVKVDSAAAKVEGAAAKVDSAAAKK